MPYAWPLNGAPSSCDGGGPAGEVSVMLIMRLVTPTGDALCVLRKISPTSALVETDRPPALGTQVRLDVSSAVVIDGTVVASAAGRIAVAFDHSDDTVAALTRQPSRLSRQRVRSPRFARRAGGRLTIGGAVIAGETVDISLGGVCLAIGNAKIPDRGPVQLKIDGLPFKAGDVRWSRDCAVGVGFRNPLLFRELSSWLCDTT